MFTQCFDLECYLLMNAEKNAWKCPICNKPAFLEGLEVDQYIWGIITSTSLEVEEVTIDSNAYWKSINKYESGIIIIIYHFFSLCELIHRCYLFSEISLLLLLIIIIIIIICRKLFNIETIQGKLAKQYATSNIELLGTRSRLITILIVADT